MTAERAMDVFLWGCAEEPAAAERTLRDILAGARRRLTVHTDAPLREPEAWRDLLANGRHRLLPEGGPPGDPLSDLLVVAAGTRLPAGWDRLLEEALAGDPRLATVSPACDLLETFALFPGGLSGKRPADPLVDVNRILRQAAVPVRVPAPTALPFCFLVRRGAPAGRIGELLRKGGGAKGERLLEAADALTDEGWEHAIAPRLWVIHRASRERDGLDRLRERERQLPLSHYLQAHPLTGVRFSVQDVLARWAEGGGGAVPLQLHVSHSWGGGLEKWVGDFCRADAERTNLVLKSLGSWGAFGSRLALYADPGGEPLAYWDLSLPIHATAISHPEYRRILDEVIRRWGVDQVVVSSLIGHSLDVLETGLPTTLVIHDYYPVCPAVSAYFGGRCRECDEERLRSCLDANPEQRFFRGERAEYWLSLRHHLSERLRRCRVPLAAPTRAAATQYLSLLPGGGEVAFRVIEHGLPADALPRIGVDPEPGRRLQILVPGTLAPHKGLDLLLEAWPRMRDWVDLHFLGCGEEAVSRIEGIAASVVPSYRPDELAGHVARIAPDAGLLLSVWSETFCYTLSELWCMGIPPVAARTGSFAERIEEGETGLLFEPEAGALVERIRGLHADRSPLRHVAARLEGYRPRKMSAMIGDYHRLLPAPEIPGAYARIGPDAPATPPAEEGNPMAEGTGVVAVRRLASVHDLLVTRLAAIEGPGRWRRRVYRWGVRLWLGLPLALLMRRSRRR